ncbi:unnamed protein product [Dibothriocephalus latus]|uniref:Uncharacterized protein n=1 Tax=Dibothriocephalus latus TaxID=60516 RepID=A0A3P7MST3_DIBLA|nr:unnamed protein product [Dibothriocephalus latus]
MHPFMVASGPDIKVRTGLQHFEQIDIYPMVCALLGLQHPNKIDGRLERVIPFLKTELSKDFVETFEKYESGIIAVDLYGVSAVLQATTNGSPKSYFTLGCETYLMSLCAVIYFGIL